VDDDLSPIGVAAFSLDEVAGFKSGEDAGDGALGEVDASREFAGGEWAMGGKFAHEDELRSGDATAVDEGFGVEVDGADDASDGDEDLLWDGVGGGFGRGIVDFGGGHISFTSNYC